MQTRDLVGYVAIPAGLLLAAWMVDQFRLWSSLANYTFPWLCSALAVSMLIVGGTCLLLQCSPSRVPVKVAVLIVFGVLIIFGCGMLADLISYVGFDWREPVNSPRPSDMWSSVGEWIGLAIILSGCFAMPRWAMRARGNGTGAPE